MPRLAWSPSPCNEWLSSCTLIWHNIFALICELIMGVRIVVQDVKMSRVQEITVFGVTKVNHSAFLGGSFWVSDKDAFITIFRIIHSANSIQCNKAFGGAFGFVIPFWAGIYVIAKICGESISFSWGWCWVAGDCFITNIGMGSLNWEGGCWYC